MKCLFLFVDNKKEPRHLHSRLSVWCGQMIPTLHAWAYMAGGSKKNKMPTSLSVSFIAVLNAFSS